MKNRELILQIQKAIEKRTSSLKFVHLFSHQQDKLKHDPTRWTQKISQQKSLFQDLNLPIDYDTAVMLNEEADELTKQATTTTLPDTI